MKSEMLIRLCVIGMVIVSECGHHQKGTAGKEMSVASAPLPIDFVPPEDSSISFIRMIAWFGCNHDLDSLSNIFTNSLSANNAAVTDIDQKNFSALQDHICVKNGLRGGYQEYRWIMDHLGSIKNKALYDSVRMQRLQNKE
ncbi:MAG: hypothetical protein ABSF80_02105 [Chitinispirillaceae bacterium]